MKFMFIYPDIGGRNLNFSPAIEILSSYLKKNDIEVELIHLNNDVSNVSHVMRTDDYDNMFRRVMEANPDVIGITSTTFQYPIACKVAENLKKRGWQKLIILGGIHATISPGDLVDSPFDAFSIGEGELTLTELMKRLEKGEDITTIKGLIIKADGEIIDNGYPDVLENLDDLPKRDYEIMDTHTILGMANGWFQTSFSRGCPYACKFCINQKLRADFVKGTNKRYYRCQSVGRVISDLLLYLEHYPEIKMFNFTDDLLIMDKKWFREFAREYQTKIYEKFGIGYAINTRANFVTEEIVSLLKTSGCYECAVGFETGNEEMRNRVLAKEISDEQLVKAFGLFNQYGVRSLAFAMMGIPGESYETVEQTLQMLSELKPTLIRMSFFEPYIGTPLYDYCVENGLFDDSFDNDNTFTKSAVKMENITNRDLALSHLLFPWHLNLKLQLPEKYDLEYRQLIDSYQNKTYDEIVSPELKNEILKIDQEISVRLEEKHISHFCYFSKNKFYFNYKQC